MNEKTVLVKPYFIIKSKSDLDLFKEKIKTIELLVDEINNFRYEIILESLPLEELNSD